MSKDTLFILFKKIIIDVTKILIKITVDVIIIILYIF